VELVASSWYTVAAVPVIGRSAVIGVVVAGHVGVAGHAVAVAGQHGNFESAKKPNPGMISNHSSLTANDHVRSPSCGIYHFARCFLAIFSAYSALQNTCFLFFF